MLKLKLEKQKKQGVGGGTFTDFTDILAHFFSENEVFRQPNYENCNIPPKKGDCNPKKQFFGTLEKIFENLKSVDRWEI